MKAIIAFAVAASLTAFAWADPIIYDQSGLPYNSAGSSEDRSPLGDSLISELAAEFILDADYTITDVHWWGTYWNGGVPGRDFRIRIYDHNPAGGPGGDPALYDQFFLNSQVNETPGGNQYVYDADLGAGYDATGGEKYWISIQSVVNTTLGQWGWDMSYQDNGTDVAYFRSAYFGYPNWTDFSVLIGQPFTDTIFYLTGVPAPGALALLGLAGLVSRRRR